MPAQPSPMPCSAPAAGPSTRRPAATIPRRSVAKCSRTPARNPKTGPSEKYVQLDEAEVLVRRRDTSRSAVVAHAGSYLHELYRRQLVHQTPAALAVARHVTIGIIGLERDLQIVTGRDEPVRLEERSRLGHCGCQES